MDDSFANNHNLSSQIGFIIAIVNKKRNKNSTKYEIKGNILHWSSTKYKRVTHSVLASEIYSMVGGFNIGIVVTTTMKLIADQLSIPKIPLVIYTDSHSLYKYLIKLGTTKEKQLIINIMALRQAYKHREIHKVR